MSAICSKATLKEVAHLSGLAVSSVSNILCNSPYSWASSATRQRVFDAVKKTGYRPNRLARGLVLQKTECLAVVIPDQRNPVYAELVHGIVMETEQRGYEVFLCSTEDSVKREKEYLERLADRRCDGVILMPVHGALDKEIVGLLKKERIPWVNVGPPSPGISGDYVFQHFDEGAYLITQHLLRLGRKRIVFLAAAVTREVTNPWVTGFRRALTEAGGNADAIRHCGPGMQDAYGAVKAIFSATHGTPDALVCLNDLSAIAACRAIEDCGLSIPRDVAVAGSDDIEMGAYLHVPLTTVRYNVPEIGRKAAQMLFERIEKPALPQRRVGYQPALVVRQSCGASGRK